MKRSLILLVAFFGCTRLVGMSDDETRQMLDVSRRLDRARMLQVARKGGVADILECAQQELSAVREGSAARGHRSLQVLQLPAVHPQVVVVPGAHSLLSWLDNVSWLDLTVVPAALAALVVIVSHALR